MVGSQAQKKAVEYAQKGYRISQRRACEILGINRSTCRYISKKITDIELKGRLKELAFKNKGFGYRRLRVLLERKGQPINHKKVYRLYKSQGLHLRIHEKRKR